MLVLFQSIIDDEVTKCFSAEGRAIMSVYAGCSWFTSFVWGSIKCFILFGRIGHLESAHKKQHELSPYEVCLLIVRIMMH